MPGLLDHVENVVVISVDRPWMAKRKSGQGGLKGKTLKVIEVEDQTSH